MEPNAKVPNWGILELQGHPTDAQTPRTKMAPPDRSSFPLGPAGGALDCLLTPRNPGRGQTLGGDLPQLGFATPSAHPGFRSGQPQPPAAPQNRAVAAATREASCRERRFTESAAPRAAAGPVG